MLLKFLSLLLVIGAAFAASVEPVEAVAVSGPVPPVKETATLAVEGEETYTAPQQEDLTDDDSVLEEDLVAEVPLKADVKEDVCEFQDEVLGEVTIVYKDVGGDIEIQRTEPAEVADLEDKVNQCLGMDIEGRRIIKKKLGRRPNPQRRKNQGKKRVTPGGILNNIRRLVNVRVKDVTIAEIRQVVRLAQKYVNVKNRIIKNRQRKRKAALKNKNN